VWKKTVRSAPRTVGCEYYYSTVCDAGVGLPASVPACTHPNSLWDLVAVEASAHPISAPVTSRRLLAPRDKPYTARTGLGDSCLLLPAIHLSTMAFCWDATCEQYAILQLLHLQSPSCHSPLQSIINIRNALHARGERVESP
jgi:hypothetical protein